MSSAQHVRSGISASGRVKAGSWALFEQLTFSSFQLSPLVASLWLDGPDSLAWTAPFSASFALSGAVLRGYVIQPDIRARQSGEQPRYRLSVAATVAGLSALLAFVVGLAEVLPDEGTLVMLAFGIPLMLVVEMERAAAAAMRRRRLALSGAALACAALVGASTLGAWAVGSPRGISVLWVSCYLLLAIVAVWSKSFWLIVRAAEGEPELPRLWLSMSNVSGQVATQAPLLAISAVAASGPLSLLQGARLVFRPIVIAAGALPVHLLPRLTANEATPRRFRRDARLIFAGSICIALLLIPVALVGRELSEGLRLISLGILLLAAVVTVLSVVEATLGVWRVARKDERFLTILRLVASVLGTSLVLVLADHETGAAVLLALMAIPLAILCLGLLLRGRSV